MERGKDKSKIKNCTDLAAAWAILDSEYGDQDRLIDILISDIERVDSYHSNNPAQMARYVDSLHTYTTTPKTSEGASPLVS